MAQMDGSNAINKRKWWWLFPVKDVKNGGRTTDIGNERYREAI